MSHHLRKEKDCLNCGAIVEERYCSHCGQENTLPRERFGHIMTHFVTDYLHLDQKFFGAIKPLLFKPGFLTAEYNAGRRASYVHPFRLYIFISIFYFLLAGLIKHHNDIKIDVLGEAKTAEMITAEKSRSESGVIVHELQTGVLAHGESLTAYRKQQSLLPEEKRDNRLSQYFIERIIVANEHNVAMGEKIKEGLVKNTPKIIFFLLPVLALFLKLVYRKEKLFYVEHFYHSVYIHSFVFVLLSIELMVSAILPHAAGHYASMLLLAVPVYIYVSCRNVYKEGAAANLIKLLMASIGYGFFLLLFIVSTVLLSIAAL